MVVADDSAKTPAVAPETAKAACDPNIIYRYGSEQTFNQSAPFGIAHLFLTLFRIYFAANAAVNPTNDNDCRAATLTTTQNNVFLLTYRGPYGFTGLRTRKKLGKLMEKRGLKDGAEVGVQKGEHAMRILREWPSCQSFKLIDLWGHQVNYEDHANVPDAAQEEYFQQAKQNVEPWSNKTEFFRMLSTEAAKKIPDLSLDFVYLDARHDYCGVMEDLEAYYPKVRPGGFLAGHDFLNNAELKEQTPNQDWSLCMDGTVNEGAVKGAVEEFAAKHGLVVTVMFDRWPSWMLQKPTRMECVQS